MKRKLKKELKLLYEAPNPEGKDAFFEGLELPGISYRTFLRQQVPYIRKWNWVLEILIFVAALSGAKYMETQILWVMASFVPFLALAAVAESNRSVQYGMEELEMAARFPLKAILMSRLIIMGGSNFFLLAVCILAVESSSAEGLLYCGAMILIPYLLSAFLNLLIVRRIHGTECIYLSLGISLLVSAICGMSAGVLELPAYYYVSGSGLFLIFLLVSILAISEYRKFLKHTEE